MSRLGGRRCVSSSEPGHAAPMVSSTSSFDGRLTPRVPCQGRIEVRPRITVSTMATGWRKPYESELQHTLVSVAWLVAAVVGLVPLCGGVVTGFGPVAWIVVLGFIALWETALWRAVGVGLYVSERGVKVQSILRTTVLPWASLDQAWAAPATGYGAWAIWISVSDPARDVETPIWRKGSRASHRNRRILDPDAFGALLDQLNSEAALWALHDRPGPGRHASRP